MRFRCFDEHFAAGIEGTETWIGWLPQLCLLGYYHRGVIMFQKSVWFACPPPLLITAWRRCFGTLFDISEHALKGHVLEVVTAGNRRVEFIDVALVVFPVMDFHCALVNMRFKRIVCVGQRMVIADLPGGHAEHIHAEGYSRRRSPANAVLP